MNKLIESSLIKLKKNKISNPELELRILLSHASIQNKNIILSNFNKDDINISLFKRMLFKRLKYEPISKITNRKFFWKSHFFVNQDVLDPRPETETIIEEVLKIFRDKNKKLKILDIGTGSGCLAISLAKEFRNSEIVAIDKSAKALKVAKKNVFINNCDKQIKLHLCDFQNINDKFDIIVSNPPYLKEKEYLNLQNEIIKYEPKMAFIGGEDGLKFYKIFAKKIHNLMKINSYFICEIGHKQLIDCKEIFANSNLILKKISKDLQNIERTLTFVKI